MRVPRGSEGGISTLFTLGWGLLIVRGRSRPDANMSLCERQTPIERLIFTPSPDKLFEEFRPTDIPFSDPKLSISFETREAMEETLILLRFNCPDPRCEVASAGWADLKMHARRDHGRLIW